jgi:hypothetical protein
METSAPVWPRGRVGTGAEGVRLARAGISGGSITGRHAKRQWSYRYGDNGKDDRLQNTDFRIQKNPLNSEICIL